MLMDELIRTCANVRIAEAAVSSLGRNTCAEIEKAAARHDLGVGEYVAGAVLRFSRSGDERAMRVVACAMSQSHEPILAGLQTLLFLTLAKEAKSAQPGSAESLPGLPAFICSVEARLRRDMRGC